MSTIIERSAPSANDSNDSALQYVAIDLLENGFDTEDQSDLLEPVEDELRQHLDVALRDGMRMAFKGDPELGADYAISYLIDRLTFEDVPDEYQEEIERHVTYRLDEKRRQIELEYQSILEDALRRAETDLEDRLADWVEVV